MVVLPKPRPLSEDCLPLINSILSEKSVNYMHVPIWIQQLKEFSDADEFLGRYNGIYIKNLTIQATLYALTSDLINTKERINKIVATDPFPALLYKEGIRRVKDILGIAQRWNFKSRKQKECERVLNECLIGPIYSLLRDASKFVTPNGICPLGRHAQDEFIIEPPDFITGFTSKHNTLFADEDKSLFVFVNHEMCEGKFADSNKSFETFGQVSIWCGGRWVLFFPFSDYKPGINSNHIRRGLFDFSNIRTVTRDKDSCLIQYGKASRRLIVNKGLVTIEDVGGRHKSEYFHNPDYEFSSTGETVFFEELHANKTTLKGDFKSISFYL